MKLKRSPQIARHRETARRVGVLGGTFNPIHIGHLRMAQEAVETLKLEECIFLPAWVPPHKPKSRIVSFAHRLEMVRRAIADNSHFVASDLERRLNGKSYTVVSLTELCRELPPGTAIFFLLGADAFCEIHSWWRYRDLFRLASLVVLRRPGFVPAGITEQLERRVSERYRWNGSRRCFEHPELEPVFALDTTCLDISSSELRRTVRGGRSIRYLVPDAILSYIKDEGLYVGDSECKESW